MVTPEESRRNVADAQQKAREQHEKRSQAAKRAVKIKISEGIKRGREAAEAASAKIKAHYKIGEDTKPLLKRGGRSSGRRKPKPPFS